jgi:hypothetical protein
MATVVLALEIGGGLVLLGMGFVGLALLSAAALGRAITRDGEQRRVEPSPTALPRLRHAA